MFSQEDSCCCAQRVLEGPRMGTWQAVSVVAVGQGRGKAGDRGDGKKWIDLRDNQGLKSTGHGDRLNMGMRERKGSC